MKEKIDYITTESGIVSLSKCTESRRSTATNLNINVAKKMNLRNNINYISMEDDILASMILESDKKSMTLMKIPNPHRENIEKEDRIISITPVDTSTFTPREAFEYMRDNEINLNVFFKLANDVTLSLIHPKLLCARSTFFRRYKKIQTTGVLPCLHDKGIQVGAYQIIPSTKLKYLNHDINTTEGFAEIKVTCQIILSL